VTQLEARLEQLDEEVRLLRAGNSQQSPSAIGSPFTSTGSQLGPSPQDSLVNQSNHLQDLIDTASRDPVAASPVSRFLGPSSGISLARLVMTMIQVDTLPSQSWPSPEAVQSPTGSVQEGEASLPPRRAADHLVDVYFQHRTPHLPIIDRTQVEFALNSAYSFLSDDQSTTHPVEKDIFTTYIVLAIALCDLPDPENLNSRGRPYQSRTCFFAALRWAEKAIELSRNELDTLRAVLLLAQYIALNPTYGSLWHLVGVSVRMCIDLGLHTETQEQTLAMDVQQLQERRRLFYSAYHFDRMLSITLGRPFGLVDDSMAVPLPHPWTRSILDSQRYRDEVYYQRAHNHMFSMSVLESEIRLVRQNQSYAPTLTRPKINYSTWRADIQPRLQEWYDTVPSTGKAHPSSVFAMQAFWDSMYNNALLLLFRPYTTAMVSTEEDISITFNASCDLISNIAVLQDAGKCESLWKTVHHLFMAGLGVIYALWQSKEVRGRTTQEENSAVLRSCASLLSAMAVTFPAASSCRDVFESLAVATTTFLSSHDAEEVRRKHAGFDQRLRDFLTSTTVVPFGD
jgi:hypothetical protein